MPGWFEKLRGGWCGFRKVNDGDQVRKGNVGHVDVAFGHTKGFEVYF